MTKVNIYGLDGTIKSKTDLPDVFNTPYRPDLIKKAFTVLRSNKRQPYGASIMAGKKHATASAGKGGGQSRVPRLTQGRRGALAPGTVGGRRAHPPKTEKNWKEKINKKERTLSIMTALAATTNKEIVKGRGHKFDEKITVPVVVEDNFKKIKKTKEIVEFLQKIGVYDDALRAIEGKHIRAGKGKTRGRKYKVPKSILIISEKGSIHKSANNLTGVDVVTPNQLNIDYLAPGGDAGRLTLITESALKHLTFRGDK